jgi:membrane fusion protein, multidrug efflux system
MNATSRAWKRWLNWIGRAAMTLGFAAGVVVLLLWLAGKSAPKVPVSTAASSPESAVAGRVVKVRMVRVPLSESAVGTIRAVHETSIGSRLLARVVEVQLKAGQPVKADDVLVRLDDTDLKAKPTASVAFAHNRIADR